MKSMLSKDIRKKLEEIKRYFPSSILFLLRQIKFLCANTIFFITEVIYTPIAAAFYILGINFPEFLLGRIGHLCVEPDIYLKQNILEKADLGSKPRKSRRDIILVTLSTKIANQALLDYWGKYFHIIDNPLLARVLLPLVKHPLTHVNTESIVAERTTVKAPGIIKKWADQGTLIKLSDEHIRLGQEMRSVLGIPEGKWHACIHCREGNLFPDDEHSQSYRSGDISDFFPVAKMIVDLGGIPVRMGDSTMKPVEGIVPGLVDYAHSPLKQDWLDLYLASTCKLFIGAASGAYCMATLFGVPVVCVNAVPLTSVFPLGMRSIGIPQLHYSGKLNRLLTFAEIANSPVANYRDNNQFKSDNIALVKNSSQDIRDVFLETFEKLNGSFYTSEHDAELQSKFKSLFKPGHYLYGSASEIGTLFLRKHQNLLD